MAKRFSSHSLEMIERRACILIAMGWTVVKPVYVDWFWRGYSILLEPPK